MDSGQESIYFIRGNVLGDAQAAEVLRSLAFGEMLEDASGLWAGKIHSTDLQDILSGVFQWKTRKSSYLPDCISHPEDLFAKNGAQLCKDYEVLTKGRKSASISSSNRILGDQLFVEEGVEVEFAHINTLLGPVYLGKNAQIFEGCNIRGPFALGEESILKMGTQVYSNVSIGPFSTMGGELNTCVVWGYSAKGHHGYFGSGVMGAWCNWGAGSSNSNLKNTYGPVSLYDYPSKGMRDTNLQVCGVIMGDYVRCAINTSFYTACVIGAGAQIASPYPVEHFIPDFSWVRGQALSVYRMDKLLETLKLVFQRRNRIFAPSETRMLGSVFTLTEEFRNL